jgi:hypothetical protein
MSRAMRFNPFTPGLIVNQDMFVGRDEELRQIDRALFQTKNGVPWHFLIHGERGIGKSSLMLSAQLTAVGRVHCWGTKDYFRFLAVSVEIEPSTTYERLIRKIATGLIKAVSSVEKLGSRATAFLDWAANWEIGGVKYKKQENDSADFVQDLSDQMAAICERLKEEIDGVVIFIDEADNASSDTHLGEFMKIFTERMTKLGCGQVCVGLAGLSKVIDVLRDDHASSPRILNYMRLEPLGKNECIEVVRRGLIRAKEKSGVETKIEASAEEWIATYSEGYPHFIQQYASSAFEADNDDNITVDDCTTGAFAENGALDQLGEQYFRDLYHAQINSDDYRKVLQVMAMSPEQYVQRREIAEKTGLKETTLGNALHALKERGIIFPHAGKQGLFRLPNDSFALWIKMTIKRAENRSALKKF